MASIEEAFEADNVAQLADQMAGEDFESLTTQIESLIDEQFPEQTRDQDGFIADESTIGALMVRSFLAGISWQDANWAEQPESLEGAAPPDFYVDEDLRFHITLDSQQATALLSILLGGNE